MKKKKDLEYAKKYYKEHKKELQSYMKKYYAKHKNELRLNSNLHKREKRKKEDGLINYNLPRKNFIRDEVIKIMNFYHVETILTLESPEFLFCKQVPDKKIIVFEENPKVYNEMLNKKPKNVNLFLGDIVEFSKLPFNVDFVYLDFCCLVETSLEKIIQLIEKIKNSKLFALTVCVRRANPERGDYEFDLINKIQTITKINWKVLFGESYRESFGKSKYSSPMMTILFENPMKD